MHFVLLAGRYCIFYVIGHIVAFYLYVSFYLCMCRPMYICTGFTSCICPAFYAAILLMNIFEIFEDRSITGVPIVSCQTSNVKHQGHWWLDLLKMTRISRQCWRASRGAALS